MSDQEIIEQIKGRNKEKALLVLYKQFPSVKKLILSKGGNLEDGEDIFQDALIILCKKVADPNFVLTSKLSTYLYSICKFLWNDELKKRSKRNELMPTDLDQSEEESLQELTLKENRIKLAQKIVEELGDRCRELLLMFYSGAYRLKEICEKMGYGSENSVKNQKYKCLNAAKQKLQESKHIYQL